MAVDPGWISGHTSSLDITIISILFLVIYITVYTLCTTCFSLTPECLKDKEDPSSLLLSVTCNDTPPAPAGPQHVNHTVLSIQKTNIYSHNRAKSDGYFSQQIPARNSDTPKFFVRSTGSVPSLLPALPPVPPVLYFTRVQGELEKVPSFSSGHDAKTKTTVFKSVSPPTEDMKSVLNEEHLYECIDNIRVNGPSLPPPTDKAEENWWETESPYDTVKEWTGPTATHDFATVIEEEIKFIFPPLPAVQDETSCPDRIVLYAEVNKKNKSQKSTEGQATIVGNNVVLDEDEAPPIPDKIFD
ncbi:hypothetical protein Baya_9460 [Bagarius yarrelli]|uniref:Uncharacterized protein n=1 Tax=Bagarius yarrelli TaxID=175774 RepID=A0A556U6R0_BAGYA|nr:hypothetical protein Baya_9460 [Bagarius yarrelli]